MTTCVVSWQIGKYSHTLFQRVGDEVVVWHGWLTEDGDYCHVDPATCHVVSQFISSINREWSISLINENGGLDEGACVWYVEEIVRRRQAG